MKLKTLKKKIRKLEARLQEGPAKLAKLKQKLEAITKAKVMKGQAKKGRSRIPSSRDGQVFDSNPKEKRRLTTAFSETGRRDEANWKENEEKA